MIVVHIILYLNNLFPLEKLHHVYDGFIFPTETWPGWFLHLIKTQRINTKNAWGFAMNIFLQRLRLTQKETEDYDIANLYEAVYGIYCHIRHKRFAAKGKFVVFPEVEQLRSGIQKVCSLCTHIHMYIRIQYKTYA